MANPNAREDGKKGGRPKGSTNKLPRDLKEKVLAICDHLEANNMGLRDEAEKDPPWFYVNFLKPMLPKDVKLDANVSILDGLQPEELASLESALSALSAADTGGGEEEDS